MKPPRCDRRRGQLFLGASQTHSEPWSNRSARPWSRAWLRRGRDGCRGAHRNDWPRTPGRERLQASGSGWALSAVEPGHANGRLPRIDRRQQRPDGGPALISRLPSRQGVRLGPRVAPAAAVARPGSWPGLVAAEWGLRSTVEGLLPNSFRSTGRRPPRAHARAAQTHRGARVVVNPPVAGQRSGS